MGRLTFGKYKGATYEYVRSNEPSYLLWLLRNINDRLDKKLYDYIDSNLASITIEACVVGSLI